MTSTTGTTAPMTMRQVALRSLAVVSVVGAVIHFAVAGEHFKEYWAFGVFMLGAAWFQLGWAVAVTLRPTRLVLALGAVANAGIVVVYIVTRTVGDVVGPTPRSVEPVGFGDLFCTVCEAALVVGAVVLLRARLQRPVSRGRFTLASAAAGVAAAALLSVALVDGGSDMVMGADAAAVTNPAAGGTNGMGGMPMNTTTSISLPTTSPAGPVTMPDPNMQMEPGMKMARSSCTSAPTSAQESAAVSLVDTTWSADQKYQSLAVAKAAGFVPITPTGLPVVHYGNQANQRATAHGGPVLDPTAPQALVYANTPSGAVLAAVMYMTTSRQDTPPSPGGCLTQWHVHTNLCTTRGRGVIALADPTCPAGSVNRVTAPMLHVWFVPIPGGPTAVDAPDAQVVQAATKVTHPDNAQA
jgi:hypothetical protein